MQFIFIPSFFCSLALNSNLVSFIDSGLRSRIFVVKKAVKLLLGRGNEANERIRMSGKDAKTISIPESVLTQGTSH